LPLLTNESGRFLMCPLQRITARDVAAAEEEVRRRRRAWERFGFPQVSEREVEEAHQYASRADVEIRRLNAQNYRWMQIKLFTLRIVGGILRRTNLSDVGWLPATLLLATPTFGLAAALLAIFCRRVDLTLAGALAFYLLSWCALACVLYRQSRTGLEHEVAGLRDKLAARAESLRVLRHTFDGWWATYCSLAEVRNAQREYNAASRRHRELVEVLNSRRYRLTHSDWRSLRDVAFERFLAEVFEELGYLVETTKTTGDQGVDLIVTGKGRRIAVQSKGYTGSVGNKAVQEVHAGMTFYRCDACVAVTNSYFTSGAEALARSVGCLLIDQKKLPALIDGKLL
jgi:hypothetical protein